MKKRELATKLVIRFKDGTTQRVTPNEAFCIEAHRDQSKWSKLAESVIGGREYDTYDYS